MNREEYLSLKDRLKEYHRSQWTDRRRMKLAMKKVADAQARMKRNSVVSPENHPGATYVPEEAVKALMVAKKYVSFLQLKMNKTLKEINSIEKQLLKAKLIRRGQTSINNQIKKQPKHSLKSITQKLFNIQGLFVHDDGVICNHKGKRIGESRGPVIFEGDYQVRYYYYVDALKEILEIKADIRGLHL